MPNYVPINENLCLVEQEIKVSNVATVVKRGQINHIWIYDRSGSMSGILNGLTSQLIDLSKKIPKGDTLSLGWFSGEGNFNFVFKGFKINDDSDYKVLEQSIKNNSTTLGTTCFSEILSNVDVVINDLTTFSKAFSLHFFTDGYPVVSNYKKEIDGIFSAIKKIKGRIQSAMLVGYGTYYNKELMAQMAGELGAILIQSSQIKEYSHNVNKLITLSENQEPKKEVDPIVEKPLAIFTMTDQGAVLYSLDENGKLYVSPTKGKSVVIYYISTEKPNKKSWTKIEVKDVNFADKDSGLAKALYASSLILTQQVKTDIALEFVGKIGDKALVNDLNNAFTIEEYGRVETKISQCIDDRVARFSNGRDCNYLPPVDSFCVYDLLQILMNDNESAFFPYHEKFEYERIGVASKTREGYPKFEASKTSKCPFNTLNWHESRLNLSVLTKIHGTVKLLPVDLGNGYLRNNLALPDPFPTFVYRNYTFIKDGRINFKKFYITSSEDTYINLKNKGIVIDDTFVKDGIYGVDISTIPAINRKIACGKTSAKDLCAKVLREQQLKAIIKSLKWLRENEISEPKKIKTQYNDEQIAILTKNGIDVEKDCIFSPPVDKEESTDKYMAKYFDIKMSGLASLPTVKKVIEKIEAGKKRTPVEVLLESGINTYNTVKPILKNDSEKQVWFDNYIATCQKELRSIRTYIQETKFAVILGRKWFDEFTSRDETSLTFDGVEFKFGLGEEVVEI